MDLQAILDASDSDDERSESSHVDIERILREDDDTSGENRNDITITSLSTIETNTFQFPKGGKYNNNRPGGESKEWMVEEAETGISRMSSPMSTKSLSKYNAAHNAEDWAVLQQILGEDDDDDAWVDTGATPPRKEHTTVNSDVDVILQAIHSEDEDDEDFHGSYVTSMETSHSNRMSFSPALVESREQFSSGNSTDTQVRTGSRGVLDDTILTASSMEDDNKALILPPEIVPQVRAGDFATLIDEEAASKNALQYAHSYEKKLLRPGHREIVSPLMVKRRLKPKIELGSTMQKKQKQQRQEVKLAQPEAPRYGFSGVLENRAMPSLSHQLVKNVEERMKKVGLPTAISINSKFIAVGTQKGAILVFDLFEVLRQQLGGRDSSYNDGSFNAAQCGPVTSIDVSGNGEALIAGYTSGMLILWDVIKGVILKNISDIHPSPITAVRFLNEKDMKVVSVDSGGLVNKLNFAKNILWSAYSMETECLLDGTAGQILAMNVLPAPPASGKTPSSPLINKLVLIALSSERSSFAVAVEPSINVLHRWAKPRADEIRPPNLVLPTDMTFLPCLSWGWSLVLGGGNVLTPILARAWGCKLQLLRASFQDASPDEGFQWPAFGLHDEFDTEAPIVAMDWLGERSLAYLTVNNEFTVIDTVMMTMLERLNFSGLKLIYAEFTLSRSAPKEFEVENSNRPYNGRLCTTFQNTMRASDKRLLLLCQEEVRTISILGAKRRISALEEDGEWLEALALALDHYENTVKSQEDRQRVKGKDFSNHPEFYSVTRTEDEEWIAKLLIRYFNLAVDNAPESERESSISLPSNGLSRLDLAQSHFQMLAGVCVEFCVVVRRLDLLFGPIFRRFLSVDRTSVFLDVLEPYVLNDKLNYIAPEVMSHFVEHCKATNGIAVVERCLLHMDVTIMDFDSIIALLRKNEMFSALFHVFTHGLDDFVTPLEIIMERLFDVADDGDAMKKRRPDGVPQTSFERYGYKAIVYIQHCFAGKAFPQDTDLEPEDKVGTIRSQLLRFLQQERHSPSGNFKREGHLGSEPLGHRSLVFPYTKMLLMVDARAVLDTISIALDAPDSEFGNGESGFESIGGWEVEVGAEVASAAPSRDTADHIGRSARVPDRQQVISMLSSIILPDESEELVHEDISLRQSKTAVNAFLDFMARYLTKGVVRANKLVTYKIISRMADRFRASFNSQDRLAAQKEIIELLTALPRNAYDPDHALHMIEDAGIHRAALLLHQQGAAAWHEGGEHEERRSHHFKCAVDCYLDDHDPEFRTEVFDYAKNECAGATTTDESDAKKLKDALLSKLADLVNLDAVLAAQLVAELYIDQLDDVVTFLGEGDDVSQFMLLHAIISGDLAKIDVVAGSVLSANLSMDHHQAYLSLMAKLHPDMVYDYLSTHDNYRPEECLKLCRQYDIADASAYLLERMGNVSSALQLILQTFEGRMMNLKRTVRASGTNLFGNRTPSSRRFLMDFKKTDPQIAEQENKQKEEVEGVKRILVVALDMCDRNSGVKAGNSSRGSQHWFNVLDRLTNAKGFLRLGKEKPEHAEIMTEVLSDLLQLTMQRMVSSVPLSDLVRKVTSDNSGSRLGELREMVMSLLRTYGHETDVFSGAVNVMKYDVRQMIAKSRTSKVQGASVRTVMHQPLKGNGRTAIAGAYAMSTSTLNVGPKGDASFGDGGRLLQSNAANGGLASALDRLSSRRKTPIDRGDQNDEKNSAVQLSTLTVSEMAYYRGDVSDAHGERYVGELGDAQSYGSLHWIHS